MSRQPSQLDRHVRDHRTLYLLATATGMRKAVDCLWCRAGVSPDEARQLVAPARPRPAAPQAPLAARHELAQAWAERHDAHHLGSPSAGCPHCPPKRVLPAGLMVMMDTDYEGR